MEYKEAIDWLFAQLPMFSRVGAAAYKPGLERSVALACHFGHPERRLRSIHVAGTNGKGSVSNMIAAVLQAQGYRTALYTSPHLVDFRERMRINGEMIPREKVIEFVEKWQAGSYDGDKPSFFELTMMMAFDWFASEDVDFAVIEVGMGGRLDSTNIITPTLSVITNISKDHTQFLGDTPAKIAFEKAGIIKAGIPVVIGEATEETEPVFRKRAEEVGAPIREAYREVDEAANEALHCSLTGDYQKKNVNTARVALEQLRAEGVRISDEAMVRGFSGVSELTGFLGRWTVMRESPKLICDTGHNEAGLRYNLAQLLAESGERRAESVLEDREVRSEERLESEVDRDEKGEEKAKSDEVGKSTPSPISTLHKNLSAKTTPHSPLPTPHSPLLRFVIGFVADKDVQHILPMFPRDAVYYVTQADIPRAMKWRDLLAACRELGLTCEGWPDVKSAVDAALSDAAPCDIIYVGGSTFVVADYLASLG